MIELTESAAQKIKTLLNEQNRPNLAFRVSVRPGGCGGFSYALSLDEPGERDEQSVLFGVPVVADPESLPYIQGARIDFVESGIGGGFAVENPNAVSACGCGSSFRTKKDAGKPESC